MDQDNDYTIVQDNDSIDPSSEILGIDYLSPGNDTYSVEITNNDATEEDLHTKNVPRNQLLKVGTRRSDVGTGAPGFEPSFKVKNYKTTKTRQKQLLTKIKKLMKTVNKKQFNTYKIHQQFLYMYKKYFESEESKNDHSHLQTSSNVMFKQMSSKRGIKLFKERAVAAMYKEFNQLDKLSMPNKPVVLPQYLMKLTRRENR